MLLLLSLPFSFSYLDSGPHPFHAPPTPQVLPEARKEDEAAHEDGGADDRQSDPGLGGLEEPLLGRKDKDDDERGAAPSGALHKAPSFMHKGAAWLQHQEASEAEERAGEATAGGGKGLVRVRTFGELLAADPVPTPPEPPEWDFELPSAAAVPVLDGGQFPRRLCASGGSLVSFTRLLTPL